MKILHVLSQTELTGSEVYASHLGREQVAAGHEVFYVSDRLHVPVPGPLTTHPISKRSWPRRMRNVAFLRRFLRENKIDVVHAHSRAASWVCHWATRNGRTAYVSTVHGRQHVHPSSKAYSVYGDRVIAVCENVREHLIRELGLDPSVIRSLPNGLDFDQYPVPPKDPGILVGLLGRTSGPKGARAAEMIRGPLPGLLRDFPALRIHLAGGPLANYDAETRGVLEELQSRYPGRVILQEYLPRWELAELIGRCHLVIGSGRMAIGALGRGVPALALGEAAGIGIVNEKNCEAAIASNFGDILAENHVQVDLAGLEAELRAFLANPAPVAPAVLARVRSHFALSSVGEAVRAVYFAALVERRVPKRIPILMYHKVTEPSYASEHKTYIAEANFGRHLRTLNRLGFSSVTFADIEAAALGERALPRKPVVLTFDDGYLGTHRRALPQLRRHGHRGVFYLLGDRDVQANGWDASDEESALIGDDELRELAAAGMEIGAHSLTHRRMTELSREEALHEAAESKRRLEGLTGRRLLSYAYPYGNLCEGSKAAVRDAGFAFAVATDSGGHHFAQDPFHLFRVSMFPHDGPVQVFKKTLRSYRGYYAWKRGK